MTLSRDDIASAYLSQLLYEPYRVQEEALLAWFTSDQGVLVCAPTGTGKTLIAEAAVFEALHAGKSLYYTTPLIALTEQKFSELQVAAVRWGFDPNQIGLVTGHRRVNPQAPVLVVVAEILLNRLLHKDMFCWEEVFAVVMDEFHSFNDPERGIVWEFTLGLLPSHVKLLLLSATVGNVYEFSQWLRVQQSRSLEIVVSDERRVPLVFHWVDDLLLDEQIEQMAQGEEPNRRTPALVFCFNREECWSIAERLKGRRLLQDGQQEQIAEALREFDLSTGAGPKLRQLLLRGVGVHHAGVLGKYRRIVENLFQRKLLAVTVCTETLAAGINLPARSVVLPTLLKGPAGDKRLLDPSSAHQMFGRAGRPQYDTQGFVFALAHEDDVQYLRWKEKYDQIPADTRDPNLLRAKKALERKRPRRRTTEQYWEKSHFEKLCAAPPRKLRSRGRLPWRLLAYMLEASPEVDRVRQLVQRRLLPGKELIEQQQYLERMLRVLHRAGYVQLEPPPPVAPPGDPAIESYRPQMAYPTDRLPWLLKLRGVNPLYGLFLGNYLGAADQTERLLAWESLLELPASLGRALAVPGYEELPPGPLAETRLNPLLLQLGLATAEQLAPPKPQEDEEQERASRRRRGYFEEPPPPILTLPEKLWLIFQHDYPEVTDVVIRPVWAAGAVLEHGGNFNKFITSRGLQKQEGIVFRHLLRLILLLCEFQQITPADMPHDQWQGDLQQLVNRLVATCRQVDPESTDKALEEAEQAVDE
ncbi:MAG: hypothetical protein KatS3mg110_2170 [Pirellulaceae bacterium]|nr:MAG: hypothetical protein KatS3mg110_2170 [Pirellulaceae bacterium]